MLKSLSIKNYAIIKSVEIDFAEGFNIITGETGSGKSIIIDALLLLLGERASADIIRKNENKAIIEAVFNIQNIANIDEILDQAGIDIFPDLIIRREISHKGSRNFINDSPVSLNILKQIGYLLIDFHGQHDNQTLLNPLQHIELLDLFADYGDLLNSYKNQYDELNKTIKNLNNLIVREKELKHNLKYIKIQYDEIIKVNPVENEDITILNELKIIENSELLFNLTNEIYSILYQEDNSVFNSIAVAQKTLENLKEIDHSFSEYFKEIDSAATIIKEIASFSKDYNNRIEYSFEQVEILRNRIFELNVLMKKFGSLNEIIILKEKFESEISASENYEDEIEELLNLIGKIKATLKIDALKLSEFRKSTANKMSDRITDILNNLGINYPQFEVKIFKNIIKSENIKTFQNDIDIIEFENNGIDLVEFYFSANQGEETKPLSQVASGGEISRLMLSMKSILATKVKFPTLVFDEIDTGISGRIAQKTGLAMKKLADNHQIIAITHLPQIAALGSLNIVIEKIEEDGNTYTEAKVLNNTEKLEEIAKMLSGSTISESSIDSARELINYTNE